MIEYDGRMNPRQPYPTDRSDHEWALIKHLVPEAKAGGRPEAHRHEAKKVTACMIKTHSNLPLVLRWVA
jgi:transposase